MTKLTDNELVTALRAARKGSLYRTLILKEMGRRVAEQVEKEIALCQN